MSTNTAEHKHHILPLSVYMNIGTALIVLTVVTVWVSFFDFGSMNLLVAMVIAAFKASLVALFFMHLKYDNKLYLVVFLSAILFLAVFIIITMFDTMRRGDIDYIKAGPINEDAVIYNQSESPETIVDSLSVSSDTTTAVVDSTLN